MAASFVTLIRTVSLAAAAAVVGLALGAVPAARAHNPLDFEYGPQGNYGWANDSAGFKWDPSINTSLTKEAIGGSRHEWNDQSANFNIHNHGDGVEVPGAWNDCSRFPNGQNYISKSAFTDPAYDGVLAVTRHCVEPGNWTKQIKFENDDDVNWWIDESTYFDPNEYDIRSTATHEFGHFTGFRGHWDQAGDRCNGTEAYHTMCAPNKGSTIRRTLETHDIHTFNNAYP